MPRAVLETRYSPPVIFEITESNSYSEGATYLAAEGRITVSPVMVGVVEKRGWGELAEGTARFVLDWGGGEALTAIATWIWLKVRTRPQQFRLNGRTLEKEEDVLEILRSAQCD